LIPLLGRDEVDGSSAIGLSLLTHSWDDHVISHDFARANLRSRLNRPLHDDPLGVTLELKAPTLCTMIVTSR
jgi:hypothetical protein